MNFFFQYYFYSKRKFYVKIVVSEIVCAYIPNVKTEKNIHEQIKSSFEYDCKFTYF